jgi:hypothetical protein
MDGGERARTNTLRKRKLFERLGTFVDVRGQRFDGHPIRHHHHKAITSRDMILSQDYP